MSERPFISCICEGIPLEVHYYGMPRISYKGSTLIEVQVDKRLTSISAVLLSVVMLAVAASLTFRVFYRPPIRPVSIVPPIVVPRPGTMPAVLNCRSPKSL